MCVFIIADLMFFLFNFTFYYFTVFSLQVLLLRNNALTDEGIRKWTAPIRVKKTGPKNLQILDLSGIPYCWFSIFPIPWKWIIHDRGSYRKNI